ncbi:protein NLRC3 [Chanos chanos]|uniref:Protein NLRC3 n=1 Tax=Chanos chanos TaxID=29144 RepID=A0A6J2W0U0_CHACN|nr:protein NLRC3-like [Chanos chanos]
MEVDAASDNSLPFGQGASAFGSDQGEDEDIVPDRRLSLDFREWGPVDQGDRYDVERAQSPPHSYVSMHSDGLSCHPDDIDTDEEPPVTQVVLERHDSFSSSCYSTDSEDNEEGEPKRKRKSRKKSSSSNQQQSAQPPLKPELLKDPNQKRHPALTVDFTFKALRSTLQKLVVEELKCFKKMVWNRYPECFRDPLDGLDIVDLVDKMLEVCDIEVSLKITDVILRDMNLKRAADYLQGLCKRNEVRYDLKMTLKRKYESIYEGFAQQGQQTLFESMYTDLYITDGGDAAVNSQHEVREIEELAEEHSGKEEVITCKDIFDPEIVKSRHIRSMLTKGVAGIGKSATVQKFILDWVEGKAHQDIFFLLPLPFRELNSMENTKVSFMELIQALYPEMKEVETLDFEDCKVMFICDGVDDCLMGLDFRKTEYWCDPKEPTTVKVLITNLIRGNLLHSAFLWITSRPIAANLIPPERVHQLLEVRGFTDEQKDAYFRKKIPDQKMADKIIGHLKSTKTLYIMCHMPLFCWVACRTLQKEFQNAKPGAEPPKAITHLYTNLLLVLINMRTQKLQQNKTEEMWAADKEFLMKLGKMAFIMLEKGLFRIEKEQWKEYDLDPQKAVVETGICTEFFREKFVMYQEKVHCFVHPTMQEYMAALYVFLSFKNNSKNVLDGNKLTRMFKEPSMVDLHKSALDRALHSKNGNYDIFLRFLLGLSMEANQDLLRGFLSNTLASQQAQEETARIIRKKIKDNHYPERNENLSRCLDELSPRLPIHCT